MTISTKPWAVNVTKTVSYDARFISTDVVTGIEIERYSVPASVEQGTRVFRTKTRAQAFVDAMRSDYGHASVSDVTKR